MCSSPEQVVPECYQQERTDQCIWYFEGWSYCMRMTLHGLVCNIWTEFAVMVRLVLIGKFMIIKRNVRVARVVCCC